jgi:phosphatidylserine decarboxylase
MLGGILSWLLFIVIAAFALLLLFYNFVFLRDPKRRIPEGNHILSPADGKIKDIIRLKDIDKLNIRKGLVGKVKTLAEDVGKDAYLITIVMNIFNVHIQRSPIDGKIKKISYSKGKFFNAVFEKEDLAAIENEKNEILIDGKHKIKVIQIAGLVARRIVCYVKKGQNIKKGQKLGIIKLGSQVAMIVPASINIKARPKQKVKAGTTIIAEYR